MGNFPEIFVAFIVGVLSVLLAGWLLFRSKIERIRNLEKSSLELEHKQKRIRHEAELLNARRQEIDKGQERLERYASAYRTRLQMLTGLSAEEAREDLKAEVLQNCEEEVRDIRREIFRQSEDEVKREAQRGLTDVMQRMSLKTQNDVNATLVDLPNDDMKGRIIGREGRNIRSFESVTGVTLMIDETPGCILISSFDPVRREIAKIALDRLIKDGRIHPVSIEETVGMVRDEMKEHVFALGEQTLLKLRLSSVPPEVVSLIGKLHYRTSNNQNTLDHSVEVAYFCSLIASELQLDPTIAKRAGLFHDLGKAIDQGHEGSHAGSAANLLRRYGEDPRVVNAVEASHDEVEPASVYAGILRIADALSAARPGARADSQDGYLQRVRTLEELAKRFDGVIDAYAMQAGREIRVIVEPEEIHDAEARLLAMKIRQRIEAELNYPGTIKVTVIREQRFSDTAK